MPSQAQAYQSNHSTHARKSPESSTPNGAADFSKLSTRLRYLRDDMIQSRYFLQNIKKARVAFFMRNYKAMLRENPMRAPYLLPLLVLRKLLYKLDILLQKRGVKFSPIDLLLRARIYMRFLLGRVDMPYFELVLTTRCSLRCESCNNLMQYFASKSAYTCTLEGITRAVRELMEHVDSVSWVRIIGGEPLLFKEIDKVVELLEGMKKIKCFDIVTNGTIMPSPALLHALSKSRKSWVSISDYTQSPNLTTKLHIEQITQALSEHNITHHCLWQDENARWFDPGKIYKRNRSREDIVRNFRACLMSCVSVMSHEDILKGADSGAGESMAGESVIMESNATESSVAESKKPVGGGAAPKEMPQSAGEMFLCPIASSLSRLKGLSEFRGDFVSLDHTCTRSAIMRFYAQDFFHACDYCHDMHKPKKLIPLARQTKATLKIEP